MSEKRFRALKRHLIRRHKNPQEEGWTGENALIGLKFPQSMPNIRKFLTAHLRLLELNNWQHPRPPKHSDAIRGGLIGWYGGILGYTGIEIYQWKWGATRSSISSAIAYTLRLLAEKHTAEFTELVDEALPGWTDAHSPDEFFGLTFDPWAIPSLSEVVATADQLQAHRLWKLRVEQRVNLWRNLLLRMEIPRIGGAIKLAELGHDNEYDHQLGLYTVSSALASWGFHVMEVMGEGMPAGTFSFVLDGDPDLNLSSDLFDTLVHPTVAWLKAYAECSSQGLFPQPYRDIFYIPTATYLQGIEPLLGGASFLKTNFNVGQPWDYKKLVETNQDLPFSAWRGKYYQTGPTFDVSSPALDWINIKLEFYEQQRESDYLHSSLNLCKREKKRLRRVRRRWACIETEAEDDTEEGQRMRTFFGDVHKAPPCMTRFEKRMYRKERRAQKAAASVSGQTQEGLTDIEDMETTIFGDFFEPRTGLWWWVSKQAALVGRGLLCAPTFEPEK
ncbi:hypothetical protein MRS44_010894 [Fusarium solani]|uniref:uncharacterized protein n=1 Tax=Fusarium solani TaxID=169388 RepID=UPI0032C41350|nr:hypothetical protein MRS44_010894 [Fusarium solani]